MDLNLKGKVAVITGGGSGIGKEAALEYTREGCSVAICGRTPEKLEQAKKEVEAMGGKIYTEVVNVADTSKIEKFAENVFNTFGRLDFWVNNAAVAFSKKLEEVTEEDWDWMMSINLRAVFFGSKIATKYIRKGGRGGVIINVSSFAATTPQNTRAVYAASKIAIHSLTRTFAAEYAPYGIRVCCIVPSGTDTEMNRMLKNPVDNIALNRHGKVEEIAKPIVFLSSPAGGYVSGTIMEINGGKLCIQKPLACWDGIKDPFKF